MASSSWSKILISILVGVSLIAGLVIVILAPRTQTVQEPESKPPGPDYALPAPLPATVQTPIGGGISGLVDSTWLSQVSTETGIPERALAAYAGATIVKNRDMPSCGLGWTTLAAIGLIESDHGRHAGSTVQTDGTVTPPIFGKSLDGSGSANIPDSDDGKIDQDPNFDRAVGPMQLIPQTWRNWHFDGNGDGVEDPQNIDDAAVATSNYLCRASGDMKSEAGWRAGVGAYNSSDAYVDEVANVANQYLDLSR